MSSARLALKRAYASAPAHSATSAAPYTAGYQPPAGFLHYVPEAGYVPMFREKAIKESEIPFKETEWSREREAMFNHAPGATDLWRKVSLYIAMPAIAAVGLFVYNRELKHKAHVEHEWEERGGKPPKPSGHEYMMRRVRPFPWGGNQSLFHNDKVQARAPEDFGGEYEEEE